MTCCTLSMMIDDEEATNFFFCMNKIQFEGFEITPVLHFYTVFHLQWKTAAKYKWEIFICLIRVEICIFPPFSVGNIFSQNIVWLYFHQTQSIHLPIRISLKKGERILFIFYSLNEAMYFPFSFWHNIWCIVTNSSIKLIVG